MNRASVFQATVECLDKTRSYPASALLFDPFFLKETSFKLDYFHFFIKISLLRSISLSRALIIVCSAEFNFNFYLSIITLRVGVIRIIPPKLADDSSRGTVVKCFHRAILHCKRSSNANIVLSPATNSAAHYRVVTNWSCSFARKGPLAASSLTNDSKSASKLFRRKSFAEIFPNVHRPRADNCDFILLPLDRWL